MAKNIYTCIWCNNNASAMAAFYTGIFSEAKIVDENPMVTVVEVEGQNLMLLNGGNIFRPNPSVSFMVLCSSAEEVEGHYNQLVKDGKPLMELGKYPWSDKYGWVEDQYDVSWHLYLGDSGNALQKLVPTLMFTGVNNGKAKEAIEFYTHLFPNSKITGIMEYTGNEGEQAGNVQNAQFDINGFTLMCMDSGHNHQFNFTEGISFVVNCKNQAEIDHYWEALTAGGGKESMCGWLKDPYGLSWQIVPENIGELMQSQGARDALMQMKKIIIADLEAANKNN